MQSHLLILCYIYFDKSPFDFFQVYFVRFVENLGQDDDLDFESDEFSKPHKINKVSSVPIQSSPVKEIPQSTSYPASVSIAHLLKAGKFVKPTSNVKTTLHLESFDVNAREWKSERTMEVNVEEEKFASGAFCSAFKCVAVQDGKKWVLKKYHDITKTTITDALASSVAVHARKQVQMHAVARHLTQRFAAKVPASFGKVFKYNKVYYTEFNSEPVTVEEFVEGKFSKYINNDGRCVTPSNDASEEEEETYAKAQCLVHYTYIMSEKKLMILDIQGAGYSLYDPEIATVDIQDGDEIYFCCGNLSSQGIEKFLSNHSCNKYCKVAAKDDFE